MTTHEKRTLGFGVLAGLAAGLLVGVEAGRYERVVPLHRPKPGAINPAAPVDYTVTGSVRLTPVDVTPAPIPVTLTGYSANPVTSGAGFDLNGTGFAAGSTATWNGKDLPVTTVSAALLHAVAPTVTTSTTAPVVLASAGSTVTGPPLTINPGLPTPVPDLTVWGYRDSKRNWATAFTPGSTITLSGANFGTTIGIVKVNHTPVPTARWTDTEIEIACPALSPGSSSGPVPLDIIRADNKSWYTEKGFSINLPGAKTKARKR